MQQYIRTNEFGDRVVDYQLLDIASRDSLVRDVERLAEHIDLDLDDADFSQTEQCEACKNAAADAIAALMIYDYDGSDVDIERHTKSMLIELVEAALLAKYGLPFCWDE